MSSLVWAFKTVDFGQTTGPRRQLSLYGRELEDESAGVLVENQAQSLAAGVQTKPGGRIISCAARRFIGLLFFFHAFGGGFTGTKIADLAGELDFVAGDFAGEFDAKVPVGEFRSFHKGD